MSSYLPYLLSFAGATLTLQLVPGVATALTLRTTIADGRKAGYATVSGLCTGNVLWGLLTAAGVTALLRASPTGFMALKLAGAAYLAWLGLRLLLKPKKALPSGETTIPVNATDANLYRNSHLRGLGCTMLNPIDGVFVFTFYPQFIPAEASPVLFTLALTAIHASIAMGWKSMLVTVAGTISHFFENPIVARVFDCVAGVVFLGFGTKLLLGHPLELLEQAWHQILG